MGHNYCTLLVYNCWAIYIELQGNVSSNLMNTNNNEYIEKANI